jgi:hypothetical protein
MQVRKIPVAMVPLLMCLVTGAVRPALGAEKSDPKDLVTQTRKELMRLPYYGVYDFLVFSVDGSTVTLGGDVYNASIKKDAEREVKRIPGLAQRRDTRRPQRIELPAAAAPLRRGIADPGFQKALPPEPVEGGIDRVDRHISPRSAVNLLSDGGSVRGVLELEA